MKILLVHNYYQQAGGEDVVFEQERQLLQRDGHRVAVYCRSNWDVESYGGLKQLALARHTMWASDSKDAIMRLFVSEKPDLVHIHNTFAMISPSIYAACLEAGIPVVQTLHNYRFLCPSACFFRDGAICEECVDHSLWRSVRYGCYRNSRSATATVALMLILQRLGCGHIAAVDCYVCLTQFSRSRFIRAGLPADKLFVKPNFVYPDPGCAHSRGQHAVFVGRLAPTARVKILLEAWTQIGDRIPLVIVGGGTERAELELEAKQRGLINVRFLGQLPREQTLAMIRHARFLLFSSEWYENFPMTIAESFACGVPVICSRLGAMEEIVDDQRTGLHFSPGDPSDLAEKICWALDHPDRMDSMGRDARREYETKYTADKNYPILIDIYQRAITSNSQ